MALMKLRESISMPQSYYQQVEPTSVPKHVQESFERLNAKRLKESNETSLMIKMAEELKQNFKEDVESAAMFDKIIDKLKNVGAAESRKLWKFPVSRFGNVNGNGRIYPRELWENVINNQKDAWQGGVGLADHPRADDDPGEFKNSGIVWLDMMIDDANKLIWAIGTFVGTYGRLAQEIIEAGGRVGFSSSGFGEQLSDGKTINPDSYVIERVADIVTNPSQSVFGDASSAHTDTRTPGMTNGGSIEYSGAKKPEGIKESLTPKSKVLEEKTKMAKIDATKLKEAEENAESQTQENTPAENEEEGKEPMKEGTVLSKLEQKAIERYVEENININDGIKDPVRKLKEVKELLNMVRESNNTDLIARCEEKLVAARNELTAMSEGVKEFAETFGTNDFSSVKENVKTLAVQGTLLNEQVKDYKLLCEGLTARNQELHKENQKLKSKLSLKEAAIKNKDLRSAKHEAAANVEMDTLNEKLNKVMSDNKSLREMNEKLSKSNRLFESENGSLKARLQGIKNRNASLRESNVASEKVAAENKTLQERINALEGQVSRLQEKNASLRADIVAANEAFEAYKEDQKIENHIEKPMTNYVTGWNNFRENKGMEVESYWNKLVEQYGESVRPFERQIRGAKTYYEASMAFLRNKNSIDGSFHAAEQANLSANITNKNARKQYLEEAGMNFDNSDTTLEQVQEAELERMARLGFN